MTDRLDDLHEQFDRADQKNKRKIGNYLYQRPAQWVPRQEIVEQFNIDESGVTRHIDALHTEGFLASKYVDDRRYVQWNGRGAGGIEYWIRQAIPPQIWAAGSELRPLLTLDSLGGAYVPTILFGILVLTGFSTAISAVFIAYLPSESAFGVTVTDLVVITGIVTIMASVFLLLIPFARLLEIGLERAWNWGATRAKKSDSNN